MGVLYERADDEDSLLISHFSRRVAKPRGSEGRWVELESVLMHALYIPLHSQPQPRVVNWLCIACD